MGLFDDAVKEKNARDNTNRIKAQEYIKKLEDYKDKLSSIIADNIDDLLGYIYSNCNCCHTLKALGLFSVSVAPVMTNKLLTDGKNVFENDFKGSYKWDHLYCERFKKLTRNARINSIINRCFEVYRVETYDNDWDVGIDSTIDHLKEGKYTYPHYSNILNTFDAIDKYVSVSPESRVKNWIEKIVK